VPGKELKNSYHFKCLRKKKETWCSRATVWAGFGAM